MSPVGVEQPDLHNALITLVIQEREQEHVGRRPGGAITYALTWTRLHYWLPEHTCYWWPWLAWWRDKWPLWTPQLEPNLWLHHQCTERHALPRWIGWNGTRHWWSCLTVTVGRVCVYAADRKHLRVKSPRFTQKLLQLHSLAWSSCGMPTIGRLWVRGLQY